MMYSLCIYIYKYIYMYSDFQKPAGTYFFWLFSYFCLILINYLDVLVLGFYLLCLCFTIFNCRSRNRVVFQRVLACFEFLHEKLRSDFILKYIFQFVRTFY